MLVSFIPDANFPSSIPGIQSTLVCVNIFAQTLRDIYERSANPRWNEEFHIHRRPVRHSPVV